MKNKKRYQTLVQWYNCVKRLISLNKGLVQSWYRVEQCGTKSPRARVKRVFSLLCFSKTCYMDNYETI